MGRTIGWAPFTTAAGAHRSARHPRPPRAAAVRARAHAQLVGREVHVREVAAPAEAARLAGCRRRATPCRVLGRARRPPRAPPAAARRRSPRRASRATAVADGQARDQPAPVRGVVGDDRIGRHARTARPGVARSVSDGRIPAVPGAPTVARPRPADAVGAAALETPDLEGGDDRLVPTWRCRAPPGSRAGRRRSCTDRGRAGERRARSRWPPCRPLGVDEVLSRPAATRSRRLVELDARCGRSPARRARRRARRRP